MEIFIEPKTKFKKIIMKHDVDILILFGYPNDRIIVCEKNSINLQHSPDTISYVYAKGKCGNNND